MSKQLFAIPLLLLSLLLGACSDEEEGKIKIDDSAPAQVTNVVATSVAGGITLSWDNPSSKSFMYTKVTYTNAKGTETYELYSKEHADDAGKMQTTINGFVKTEPVTFKLFACSVRGNNSGAVEVQGTPGAPNFAKVLDKITVDPSYGGIKVGYINEFDENVIVSVSYKSTSDASKSGSCKFAVSPKSQGAQFVRLTYGNDNQFITNEECEITIHTEDNYDNASDDRTYQVTPQEAQILDRSKWSGRLNADYKATDELKFSTNIAYEKRDVQSPSTDVGQGWFDQWFWPIYNENGEVYDTFGHRNPIAGLTQGGTYKYQLTTLRGNVSGTYDFKKFVKGLTLTGNAAYKMVEQNSQTTNYKVDYHDWVGFVTNTLHAPGSMVQENKRWENITPINRKFPTTGTELTIVYLRSGCTKKLWVFHADEHTVVGLDEVIERTAESVVE
jgi:hypothetical protein